MEGQSLVHPEYNPYKCLGGTTACLGFQSGEAETGDPQSKLTSKTNHWQDPCLENKEEVLSRTIYDIELGLHMQAHMHLHPRVCLHACK